MAIKILTPSAEKLLQFYSSRNPDEKVYVRCGDIAAALSEMLNLKDRLHKAGALALRRGDDLRTMGKDYYRLYSELEDLQEKYDLLASIQKEGVDGWEGCL